MTDNAYPLSYIEGEQSIIGGLMLSNDAIDACSDLRVGMFFDPANAKIYQAIVELIADGKPADVVTVHEALEACGLDDVCGGISYLATVSQNTPSAANIRRYVDIVKDRASERQLLQVGDLVRDLAVERNGRLISDRHAEAVRLLGEIEITAIEGSREKTAAEALHDGIREIDHRLSVPEGELGGLHTGLRELDRMLDGLHKGELIIVGARPSMGKSCIGEMISRVNAKRGYAVRFQSYEMPAKHLMFRSAAAEMEINLTWLNAHGFSVTCNDCYVAPLYPSGQLTDLELLQCVKQRQPRYILINIGGGVQERLGHYLRKHLPDSPAIICVGAAIAFITGLQANIPVWADAYGLGWFLRCLQAPGKFIPRYWKALRLVVILARYRERSVAG